MKIWIHGSHHLLKSARDVFWYTGSGELGKSERVKYKPTKKQARPQLPLHFFCRSWVNETLWTRS